MIQLCTTIGTVKSNNCVHLCFVISWASKDVVWNNMLEKDKTYTRDVHMMEKHPHLQPKMRAILLDWLMEVRTICKQSVS